MKKLFTTLVLCASISMGAFAQHCAADSTAAIPPPPTGTPGLTPVSDSLAPAQVGTYLTDTIYFNNYSTFSTQTLTYLTIDSINNLPTGLCWLTNTGSNQFAGGASGLIVVSGTPQGTPGQYKLVIWITAKLGVLPPIGPSNAEQLTGATGGAPLRYYVRLNCAHDSVAHPIDTVGETSLNTIFEPYTALIPGYDSIYCGTTGVREITNNISNVSVEPNPFTSSANVKFTSNVGGTYTMKMVNLLGAVVSSKEINIVQGENTIEQDRNGLSSGIYLLSISNGQSAITRKVIIE